MSDNVRFLLAAAGFAVFFAAAFAGAVIQEVALYRLHRDHPATWERLGRPCVLFVALPTASFGLRVSHHARREIWRWTWRMPKELQGDATLRLLLRLYASLSVVAVLGWVAIAQWFFLVSDR